MLADYLHAYLGNLAAQLNWNVESGSYNSAVIETLEKYGVETEAQATNTKKLHALGKVELWKAVLREVSFDYDFSADGASYKRSQLHELVSKNLAEAFLDAFPYLPEYQIEVGEFTTEEDPYKE